MPSSPETERSAGFRPALRILAGVQDTIQALLILLSSFGISALVISRYFFHYSDPSVEVISRYLMIWATFVGLSSAQRQNLHVRVELLALFLGKRARREMEVAVLLLCTLICLYIAYSGWLLAVETKMLGERLTTGLRLPLWIPKLAVLVGGVLLAVQCMISAYTRATAPEETDGGR